MVSEPFRELERFLLRDPGSRGAQHLVLPGELEAAARSLHGARHTLILTGFPVLRARAGETDGPGAAVALGEALRALGSQVTFLTDSLCAPLLQALGATPLEVLSLKVGDRDLARAALERLAPTHLLAIERPGRAADGRFRNMQGEPIDALTSALDELLLVANGVATVAIGDGGNEAGLARTREAVLAHVAHGEQIATVVPADHTVAAGVSEWGGWVLVAGLSLLEKRDLLPEAQLVRQRLGALVAAGAVDGVTAEATLTVDARPLQEGLDVLAELRSTLARLLHEQGSAR